MTDPDFPSDDELDSRDAFAHAAEEVGTWTRWSGDALPGRFRVEIEGAMLWTEPRAPGEAPPSRFTLSFADPVCVAFLSFDPHDAPPGWPGHFLAGEVGPFRLREDHLTLSEGGLAARIVADADHVEALLGDPATAGWNAAHAVLAFRAGGVGLAVAARDVTLLDADGEVPWAEVGARHQRWWEYWREYWARRDTDDPLPHDPVCEWSRPVAPTPETGAAWAADPWGTGTGAPPPPAGAGRGETAGDSARPADVSSPPPSGWADAHVAFAGAVAEMGLWTWWDGALPGRFQVELGNVMLWNAPREAGQAPPNRFALSCVEPACVAFLRFGAAGGPADGWPERFQAHEAGPFELDGEGFALGDHDRALAIRADARAVDVRAGDAREDVVRAAPAVLAFRAGDVGLLVAAARIELLDFSGAVPWDEVPARRTRWWGYWREYWDRKDTADEMPWDLLCEVHIPLGPSGTAGGEGRDLRPAEAPASPVGEPDEAPIRAADGGGAAPVHAVVRARGPDWLGAALPAFLLWPITLGGTMGVWAEEGISGRTAAWIVALVLAACAAWTLLRVRAHPRDAEYAVGPTGVRVHVASRWLADDDASVAWSEMELYRVRTSPRHGRRTLVVRSYGGRRVAVPEGGTAEERAAFARFLAAFLATSRGRVPER